MSLAVALLSTYSLCWEHALLFITFSENVGLGIYCHRAHSVFGILFAENPRYLLPVCQLLLLQRAARHRFYTDGWCPRARGHVPQSGRQRCTGWAEPRAAGTSPGAQHVPEPCRGSWPRRRAPRHAHIAAAPRKSVEDGQNSSSPVLRGFVPYAEVMVILPGSARVLSVTGVTKEPWESQHSQPSVPCSSSWLPNLPQTLGRSGKETGLSSATTNCSGMCHCKMGSHFPLESRSKSPCSRVLPYIQGIFTASLLQLTQEHERCPNAERWLPEQECCRQPRTAPGPLQHRPAPHTPLHLFQRVY